MYPYDDSIGVRTQVLEYRRVAVADDFFDIISSVHINERGIHVGQKKTYRAVGRYSDYYVFMCSDILHWLQRELFERTLDVAWTIRRAL